MKPVLSVVVPSYNVEQYLEKGLSSYADERFNGRLEIIVVNDGSTDKTHDIAASFVENYSGIFTLIDKENGGHGSAVNCGIDNAKGKFFRIIDGDDWINTENMVKLLDVLEVSDADIVVDNKREVDMLSGESEYFSSSKGIIFNNKYYFTDVCLNESVAPNIMIHTMSIRTSILRDNNIRLLEGIFYVDIEFVIKSTVFARTVEFVDLEIYQYLVGNANQSVNFKNYVKRFDHHKQVTRELVSFATRFDTSDSDNPKVLRKYLDRRICLLINTHMNIALIYDIDRNRGLNRARDFRWFLFKTSFKYFVKTIPRYLLTLTLHYLGINYGKLQSIKSFRR